MTTNRSETAAAIKSVLVIDGSRAHLEVMERFLKNAGITATVEARGDTAMALAETDTPDLIITEAMLPGERDFETLKRLKASPTLKDVPVIVASVCRDAAFRQRALELGACDTICKPYDIRGAMERVRVILDRAIQCRSNGRLVP
ncbi:MAG: response regulator [Desulfobacterales bacterium]|jgi:two-component system phosphate regulon response regulator PhoB